MLRTIEDSLGEFEPNLNLNSIEHVDENKMRPGPPMEYTFQGLSVLEPSRFVKEIN